jgi:hypothetical protein
MSGPKLPLAWFRRAMREYVATLLLRLAIPVVLGSILAGAVGMLAGDSSVLAKAAAGFGAGVAALIAGRFSDARIRKRSDRRAPIAA